MVLRQLQSHIEQDGKQLTTEAIEAYLDELLEHSTRRTFNCYLTAIRSFCNWRSERFKVDNPAACIHIIKEDPPRQRVLSEEEYVKVLKHARGMDLDIIEFLANTGLRRDEFRRLTWADIPDGYKFIRLKGKGRKGRVIPLNATCKDILNRYDRVDGPVQFAQRYPGREGTTWLCKRISRDIDIPRFGPHALRHFFATRLIKAGVSIYKVSKILGHSSVKTTESVYAHLVPQDLLGATDALDEL